jgi:hypothetical protein
MTIQTAKGIGLPVSASISTAAAVPHQDAESSNWAPGWRFSGSGATLSALVLALALRGKLSLKRFF